MCFKNIDWKKLEEMLDETMNSLDMKRIRKEEDLLNSITVNLEDHAAELIEFTPIMLNPRDMRAVEELMDVNGFDNPEHLIRNLIFDKYLELKERR